MPKFKDPVTTEEVKTFKDVCGGHWEEHPYYPVSDWQAEVEADDTRLGYWEWVYKQEEGDDDLLVCGVAEKELADKDVRWALQELLSLTDEWLEKVGEYVDDEVALKRRAAVNVVSSVLSRLESQEASNS